MRVNRLLDRADPTLSALGDHRLPAPAAQRRLVRLERRFAADAVRIAAVTSPAPPLPADLQAAGRGEIAPSPSGS
ncbi:MAG TPA: hypothetical protein VFX44_08020 [Solirubrobacterales bacterium]|nr:hypothetical protein [Solirubrobacterales bacterium]